MQPPCLGRSTGWLQAFPQAFLCTQGGVLRAHPSYSHTPGSAWCTCDPKSGEQWSQQDRRHLPRILTVSPSLSPGWLPRG